ncbi:MAG: hypothetical protein K6F63_04170 [Lachnospiraceae bacterium]|nr:hypothetical protein [Lachnospiraceae bacterium]
MKADDLIRIAYRDLHQKKRKFRIFEISLLAGLVCLLMFSSLSDGVIDHVKNMINSKKEYKTITVYDFADENEAGNALKNLVNVEAVYKEIMIYNVEGIEIDGRKIAAVPIKAAVPELDSFFEIDAKRIFVAGRDLKEGDTQKTLIDEYTVKLLGMGKPENILGKTVTLTVDGREIRTEIVGVYASAFGENAKEEFDLQTDAEGNIFVNWPIIVSSDCVENTEVFTDGNLRVLVRDVSLLSETIEEAKRVTGAEAISDTEKVYSLLEDLGKIKSVLQVVAWALLAVSFVTIVSVLYVVIESNRKWYEMLNVLGYRRSTVRCINAAEVGILTGKAVILAGLIVFSIVLVINNLAYKMMGECFIFDFPVVTFLQLVVIVTVTCNAVSLIFTHNATKNEVNSEK